MARSPILSRFLHDERGIAMVFVAIMIPVLVGFALLAIDMSRVNNLHNDLQKGADAFALAGAAELDGSTGATLRATAAIHNLVTNQANFSSTGDDHSLTTDDVTITFLKGLPDDKTALDDNGIDADGNDWHTTDDGDARFVEVTLKPNVKVAGFATIFPASFLGGSDSLTIGSQAVAGFQQSICDVTPMYICNPFEPDGLDFADAFAQGKTYSRLFTALKVDSSPGAGNYGLLDFSDSTSVQEAFAKGSGGECYQQTSVTTKTGVTLGQVNTGLNVRFDIYSGSVKKHDADFDWRPSINVRKGAATSSNCNKFKLATDGSAMGFPPGSAGTYPDQTGVSGENWDRSGYWNLNHLDHPDLLAKIPSKSDPVSQSASPSRYDVYRYEIDNDLVGDQAGDKNNGETGDPACYAGPSADITEDPDRRVIVTAIVNCTADAGKIAGKTALRPDLYASIFLTNPVQKNDPNADDDSNSSEKPIDFEVVDVTGPKGNGTLDNFLHDEAQLYR